MSKRVVMWVLIGWAASFLLSPRDVIGWFRPKTS